MAEVDSVVAFLRQTEKGQLKYDRDWASSKEGVQQMFEEISFGINQMTVGCDNEEKKSLKEDLENISPENLLPKGAEPNSFELRDREVTSSLLHPDHDPNKLTPGTTGSARRRSDKYFGLNPLHVTVNRSAERNIDNPKMFIFTSPLTNSASSSILEDSIDASYAEDGNTSVFEYSRGFLVKVAQRPVSVDVLKLRLETVQNLLGVDRDDSSSEEEEDLSSDEYLTSPGGCAVDQKLVSLREELKSATSKKNAEILQKYREKSEQLAKDAEERYQHEIREVRRNLVREEEKVLEEIRKDKLEAEHRIAKELAADKKRKEEVANILKICKEHEDRIKAEEEMEARKMEQKQKFSKEMSYLKDNMMKMLELWSKIEDKSKFSEKSRDSVSIHTEFSALRDDISKKLKSGAVVDEDWSKLRSIGDKMKDSVRILTDDIQAIHIAEEKAKAAEVANKKAEEEAKLSEKTANTNNEKEKSDKEHPNEKQEEFKSQPVTSGNVQTSQYSVMSGEEFYRETIHFKTKYVEEIAFADNEKKVKSELTLAITTAVNAISPQTTAHLNDKLERLTYLLAGKPITLKDGQICAANHQFGIKYCMALLAKKIVRQGEDMVSSKAETAFPFASVALALWDTFPDFGKLLLAYFFEFCPFLAPCYPEKNNSQSEKEQYLALGYKYEKDEIEKQDKYLKRMAGLAQLFSAIMISHKPLGSNSLHPFGLTQVWTYLAHVLNRTPLSDVTATILLVVLETTGNSMIKKYGDQFFKLILFIKDHYLPQLEAVKTDGGPTVRLETFLSKVLVENRIESPKGMLSASFIKKVNIS